MASGVLEANAVVAVDVVLFSVRPAASVEDAWQVLLVRREEAAFAGKWSLPGGWADLGLSPSEVAVKEVREETGYAVRPVKLLEVEGRHPAPTVFSVYKLFLRCTPKTG